MNQGPFDLKLVEDCENLVKQYTDETKYFVVYRCDSTVNGRMFVTEKEEQARQFCEENNWEWKDDNKFVWGLDYSEV